MAEKIGIRQAITNLGFTQEQFAKLIGISRPTLCRHLNSYENTGVVNNRLIQKEFDRIMSEERLKAMNADSTELVHVREKLKSSESERKRAQARADRLLLSYIAKHPDISIHDKNGVRMYGSEGEDVHQMDPKDRERLKNTLTDKELDAWRQELRAAMKALHDISVDATLKEALELEKMWDNTVMDGKPRVYKETVRYIAEWDIDENPSEEQATIMCLTDGKEADICMELLLPMYHDYEIDAEIEVITADGIFPVTKIKLEETPGTLGWRGHVSGLYPGYKYVFRIEVLSLAPEHSSDLEETSMLPWAPYYTMRRPLR